MDVYEPPSLIDRGSLSELTKGLLPSAQVAGPMAALSAPMPVGGNAPNMESFPSGGGEAGGGSGSDGGGPGGDGGNAGAAGGAPGGGDGGADVAGATAAQPAPAGGSLPFTGLVVGAVGAAGAALTGAGVALRRALRRS